MVLLRRAALPPAEEGAVPHWRTHLEASLFGAFAAALLLALGAISYLADWKVLGKEGWVWFAVFLAEALLIVGLLRSGREEGRRRLLVVSLVLGVLGNLVGVFLLVGALVTTKSSELSADQLLTTAAVVWVTNVIVFGLCFWTLDAGGPAQRVRYGRLEPDFRFPQDDGQRPWNPSFEDYLYVATTNGIAFSPTDAMPLTHPAKRLMTIQALISVAAVLVIAARAVNVLGS
jgi:uncharacterized membrane protein